ncbi:hypothetical protein BT67DRAFT_296649 [Trichocladium antarcticum]|uniref:Uncharacterized protein n=1 Tax=Trichocladium antarcticum TaxID=1450529 RepID=A0AAN6UK64_9PEZI|nr:hypothetical protein BT67DRAFT_296649 [Trichocladium antarcticum]
MRATIRYGWRRPAAIPLAFLPSAMPRHDQLRFYLLAQYSPAGCNPGFRLDGDNDAAGREEANARTLCSQEHRAYTTSSATLLHVAITYLCGTANLPAKLILSIRAPQAPGWFLHEGLVPLVLLFLLKHRVSMCAI